MALNLALARIGRIEFLRFLSLFDQTFRKINLYDFDNLVDVLHCVREKGRRIFIAGNGGSAANASHFAEDLALCSGGTSDKPFRAVSLSADASYLTALGNDEGYDNTFVGQLRNLCEARDLLIVISASGNSPNILKALDFANSSGLTTFGLLGFDGGKALTKCRYSILVPTNKDEYGLVETVHLAVIHVVGAALRILSSMLQN